METEEQIKNKKLMALKHEVTDLHPVLETLFERLPNISSVENTHGSREHGADFLLERRDETLGETEHIGVIVKSGNITPGDTGEVSRQIKECQIPKNVSSGTQKAHLRIFWVVTNGKITGNSKDLIASEFQNLNITFIPQHKLRNLINSHYELFWRNIPQEISLQLEKISREVQDYDSQVSILPQGSETFYVPQALTKQRTTSIQRKESKNWTRSPEKTDFVQTCKRKKLILVEGGYGSGKSKLLRQTVIDLSSPTKFEQIGIIPHYSGFWNFANDSNCDPEQFLSARDCVPDLFSENFHQVIFLDSFDESKADSDEQIAILEKLQTNIEKLENVSVVVATRPLPATVKGTILNKSSELLELRPLSFSQVISFIERLCKEAVQNQKLISDLKSSQLYQDLPKSPISAILLGKLLSENFQDIPSNLTELYSKYLDYAMGRWDQKKGLQTEKEYKTLSNILIKLSEYFFENKLPAISAEECENFFIQHVTSRNSDLDGKELFKLCLERSEVLVQNPFDSTISFKHRTYCEFLYSLGMRNNGNVKISDKALDPYLTNVAYFLFGLKSDCPEMVAELLTFDARDLSERWCLVMNYSRYLLAASETEYQFIVPVLKKVILDFVSLYKDSRDGKTEFPKGRLTKMQFLSLVTPLFQTHYGYRFFQDGLEDIALELEKTFSEPEDRCIAAFFISFARLGFDDPKLVDELVKSDTGYLPPEMQIITAYEADRLGCRSAPVKKHLKHISRKLFAISSGDKNFTKKKTPAQLISEQVIK